MLSLLCKEIQPVMQTSLCFRGLFSHHYFYTSASRASVGMLRCNILGQTYSRIFALKVSLYVLLFNLSLCRSQFQTLPPATNFNFTLSSVMLHFHLVFFHFFKKFHSHIF